MDREELIEAYPETELVFLDPVEDYDRCIIGVARRAGGLLAVAYDEEQVLAVLQMHHGMSRDEAVEYFEFNIIDAYVGEQTPVFITMGG